MRASLRNSLIIIVTTLLLGEVSLRLYHYINPVFVFPSDSYNRFRGKPFEQNYDSRLNSGGFNDVEFRKEKDPGVYRILGIGDSFAFSVVPYRYNYLTLLEERLNANLTTKRYEVINMGIPGTNLEHYRSLLVREGLELHPDLVIIFMFVGNDLMGTPSRPWATSYVASLIAFLLQAPQQVGLIQVAHRMQYDDEQPSFDSYDEYLGIELKWSPLYLVRNPDREQVMSDAMGHIKGMRDICTSNNIRLLMVMIPDEMQLDKALQQRAMEKLQVSEHDMDFALPNRLLAKDLSEAGIAYLDLLEPFQQAGHHTRLYKPQDTHWNIAGNKLAAEIIGEYLLAKFRNDSLMEPKKGRRPISDQG